jgi:short-subunit dehydrogenase
VSKHAVVALSESLYLALDQRKSRVKVSVLCPASVKTNIVNSERSRPVELQNESDDVPPETRAYWAFMNTAVEGGISPLQVADQVFRAMREERFYILTHPEWLPVIQLRVDNLLRADNPKSSAEAIRKISKPTG